jgi:HSP20 family protein
MTQTLPESRRQQPLERQDSFARIDPITDQMRRLLDQTFGEIAREAGVWVPDVDIEEQDDAYLIEAEIPGVEREDIDVEIMGNELVVSGDVKKRERSGILRRRTRRVGRFELRVLLPDRVESNGVSAHLDKGVLTVRVPKSEAAQRRRVEVES